MHEREDSGGRLRPRSCESCDSVFSPRAKQQIFCSSRCRTLGRRKRRNADLVLTDRRCEWCGNRMAETMRSHAVYCSDRCRREAFKVKPCFYCGEPAQGRDHFVPRSFQQRIEDFGWAKKGNVLVPACTECNSTANDKVFKTLTAKRAFIHSRYRVRYAKLLDAPHWTQEEIDELGKSLRSHVERSQYARDLLRQRLRWPRP